MLGSSHIFFPLKCLPKHWLPWRETVDQRIIGDGDFVEQMLSESEETTKENLRFASGRMELSELAQKVSTVHHISQGELRSGSNLTIRDFNPISSCLTTTGI
jgi:hypothetical protein